MHLRDMWTVDGLYYLGIEEKWGTEAATEVDRKVWEVMGKLEARRLKKFFDITGTDIPSMIKALRFSGWSLDLEDKEFVVEDDKAARIMAVNAIKELGHVVLASPNGKHAYETLKANQGIDLVLTDIMMPEMDGWQLIQIIREDAELADLPIIAMSAVTEPDEISDILELGATLFMDKPFTPQDLQENVGKCLEGGQRSQSGK